MKITNIKGYPQVVVGGSLRKNKILLHFLMCLGTAWEMPSRYYKVLNSPLQTALYNTLVSRHLLWEGEENGDMYITPKGKRFLKKAGFDIRGMGCPSFMLREMSAKCL